MLSIPLDILDGSFQLADYRELLRNVFESIPASDRLAFLREVVHSLDEGDRRDLLGATISGHRKEQETPLPTPLPPRAGLPVTASRSVPLAAGRATLPRQRIASPWTAARPADDSLGLNLADHPAAQQAKIDEEFKKLTAVGSGADQIKQNMRRELISCFALGVLGLAILVALSLGAGHLWKYLQTLF